MNTRHLTASPAMVVACLALFVALGGTALATSYVISSNGQVAPATISGHNPPTGDHANLIAGSVNSTDVAPSAVTSGKLATGAVTNRALGLGAVAGDNVQNGSLTAANLAAGTLPEAFVSNNGTPASSPSVTAGSVQFDVTSATKNVLVLGSAEVEPSGCVSICTAKSGLYVDGQPVGGTVKLQVAGSGNPDKTQSFIGQVSTTAGAGLSVGSHTLEVGAKITDCAGGDPCAVAIGDAQSGALDLSQ